MKRIAEGTIGQRVLASALSFLMIISLLPTSMLQVKSAATEQSDFVMDGAAVSDGNAVVAGETKDTTESSVTDGDASGTITDTPDIENVSITMLEADYVKDTEQDLVIKVETDVEGVTIEYSTDGTSWNQEVPKAENAGEYPIYIRISKDGYNTYESGEKKAKINKIDIMGIDISSRQLSYLGEEQELVSLTGSLEDSDSVIWMVNTEETEGKDIPKREAAGTYKVKLTVNRGNNYNEFSKEVDVYITKAKQSFSFNNVAYNNIKPSESYFSKDDLEDGKEYDFAATDSDALAAGTISYAVGLNSDDSGIAYIDADTGILTVNGPGTVTVIAKLSGSKNYEECTIEHTMDVIGIKKSEGDWVKFPNDSIEYVVGNMNGIPSNVATHVDSRDNGKITYSIENADEIGLKIDGNGTISVENYSKLISAMEAKNGNLAVNVKAVKAEMKSGRGKVMYPEDSATYSLIIKFRSIPENPYKIYSVEDMDTELTASNGNEGWYNTAVAIVPIEGYKVIREDALLNGSVDFANSVKFGEITDGIANDQGAETNRVVYLQHQESGEITGRIVTLVDKLDNIKPYGLAIDFPETTNKDDIKYYDDKVSVTFTAYDNTSGVKKFNWEYMRAEGSSESILESDSGEVEAVLDTSDSSSTKYVGTIVLPKKEAEQLRGRLKVSAEDVAGNVSDSLTDEGVFVVDTDEPTRTVTYQVNGGMASHQTIDTKHYVNEVEFTFKIVEANFFADDVYVTVSKNQGVAERQILLWTPTGETDEYEAKITLSEDADYVVALSYKDRSGNEMTSYTSETFVVDTIAPTMTVEYTEADNTFAGKDYYKKTLTASFTVTEANFFKEDVVVKVKKDDGNAIEIEPVWMDESIDVHIGTYTIEASDNHSNDGDYVFIVEYTDRSNNEMASYTSDVKVIDTTVPVINVEYSNTNPMNTLTDSEGHTRKYFASANTATITVTEHNFNPDEIQYTIIAKDIVGNELNADALHAKSSWTTNGDNHVLTITYPGDANYSFDIAYTDLAKLESADYNPDYFTVDTTGPTDLQITYSTSVLDTVLSNISFGFYNAKATVTITATDNTSGINSFKYSYINAEGVSNVNAQLVDEVIDSSGISLSNGGATGTVTFEIPKGALTTNNQFNGTVNFVAADRANNESDYLRDTKRIVVDNIAPTATVQYNAPVQESNGISYYDGDISATVTINEANFYPEDVVISVTKDGVADTITANWSLSGTDVHIGTFTLSEDADYFVRITYADKSGNIMQEYSSEQMTIDTDIAEATITINGQDGDGKAYKDEVVPAVSFEDQNFESYEIRLYRTSYADKNVDVTDKFIAGHMTTNATGGGGTFDTFEKIAENDGIYTLTVSLTDKAGHSIEKSATFTVNRFGSVYEYSDYLISLLQDGGAYVQEVDNDFVITEYNADRLVNNSLNIEISRDGRPLEESRFRVTPEINDTVATGESGWFQYAYTISKDNFASDGIYKIAVSSRDATGNSPENSNYEDKGILFRVDSTAPEITSITGLEDNVINATEKEVKYTAYDTIGLKSISVYVDGKEIDNISDFTEDANNFSGAFTVKESANAQKVRLVVTDKAGNVTDTDSGDFSSSYVFSHSVTVSTNFFVRWFADKTLFLGTVGGGIAVIGGLGIIVFFRKRKKAKA